MENIKIYSVNEVTTYIKNLIESDESLQDILVEGEISNFRQKDREHMYFSLKDKDSIIGCVMFHRANINLDFQPRDGMMVMVRGSLDIYKTKGTYQIIVEEMNLIGKGELYIKFLELKERLEKEGLFEEEFKKAIPQFPKTVGIITSFEGAAIQDVIKVIKRRCPHVKLIIYPSLVQGDGAKDKLVKGIKVLNKLEVDVMIIARGGGSFEDLWPFNEEIVAKEIFNSRIPIITGIGHETDFTIADFVSDKRAPTPSAAAELAVPNETEVLENLVNLKTNLFRQMTNRIEFYKQKMLYIKNRPIFRRPFKLINEQKQFLDEKTLEIKQIWITRIEILKRDLKGHEGKLNALSPYAILDRGYSITMKEDKILSSVKDINVGECISTIVKDGKIDSRIQNKDERKII